MGWIRWTGKALELAGKLAQSDSFDKWAEDQGKAIVEKFASEKGRSLFHNATSRAKTDLWKDLAEQFKSNAVFASTMQKSIAGYTERFSTLAATPGWPFPDSALHMRVLPLVVVNRNERKFWQGLDGSEELANLKGGAALRAYFFDEMTEQLGDAFSAGAQQATPSKPIQLEHSRWIVGFDPDYEWNGSKGHYYVFSYFSQTAEDSKGAPRKEAEKKAAEELDNCRDWLFNLPPDKRKHLADSLPS